MMAISVISSASVAAAPALAGMTSTEGTSAGFADLLFSQLGLALTAAGTPVASAAGNEKASNEKTPTTESDAPSGDPALVFLMGTPILPPQTPAKSATAPTTADVAIGASGANAQPGQSTPSVSDVLTQTAGSKRTASPATPATPSPAAPENSTKQTNFAAALEQQGTSAGNTSPGLVGLAIPPGVRPTGKNTSSETPSATSPMIQPTLAEKPLSPPPATLPPVAANPAIGEKALDMPAPAANIAADATAATAATANQESGILPAIVGNTASKTESAAPAKNEVSAPLHSNAWSHDFSDKVVWLAKNDQQQAQININPPQLGPIQITLNLNGDQASAVFTSPHAEVRQAIENSLPQLKEMLSGAGINLGQADVGANLAQQQRETPGQSTNGNRLAIENAILPGDGNAGDTKISTPLQRGRGMVDLFA